MDRVLQVNKAYSQTPGKPSRLLRTEFSNQLLKGPQFTQDFYSKELYKTNQFQTETQNFDYSPKKRSKSLYKSASSSKQHIFQTAKAPHKQDRLRSSSVKVLMQTQPLNNLNMTQRPSKKQSDFIIPTKTSKNEGNVINEKKTVEDIMNRLKNKKSACLKIVKDIHLQEKTNTTRNLLDQTLNFQELSKGAILISNQIERKALEQQKQAREKEAIAERQRQQKLEREMKQMLEEKSKSLEKTQLEVNKKLNLIENMMSSFKETVKTKEKELSDKQIFLREKEKQIQFKINEVAKNIQMELSKSLMASQVSSQRKPNVQLKTISPKNSRVETQKQFFPSPSNKFSTINQRHSPENQERFNYYTIESGNNDEHRKVTIQQEESEPGIVRTATFNRYNTSDLVDLDQIETINFKPPELPQKPNQNNYKTLEEPPKLSNQPNLDTKRPSSSKKGIKSAKDYPFASQESPKFSNTNTQREREKQKENQIERERQLQREREKQRQRLKQLQKERHQMQKQREQKQRQKRQKKEKQLKKEEGKTSKSRKQSMNSSVSERQKQQTEQGKQKKKEEKQKTAQIVKAISRVNELVYFIGQIPHHCSNNMKKKKKYTFKLATLYLLKYVYDKFRYLTKLCQDLLKKKAVTKEYIELREKQNSKIKQSYQKMKTYVYKKQPFPPKQSQKFLDQNSAVLCIDDRAFVKEIMFKQIKEIIKFYHDDTDGKWSDHQVNLCYYRMFLAVFILQEIEFGNIVLDTEDSEYPDYMLGEIENFTQDELKEKMSQCYEIFNDLDID